jgi:hypothetical protein
MDSLVLRQVRCSDISFSLTTLVTTLTAPFWTISSGLDKDGYCHELFLRGKQFLANRINRVKNNDTGARNSDRLPKFYFLAYLPEAGPNNLPEGNVPQDLSGRKNPPQETSPPTVAMQQEYQREARLPIAIENLSASQVFPREALALQQLSTPMLLHMQQRLGQIARPSI